MRRVVAALSLIGLALAQEGHRVAITHPVSPFNRETNFLLIWVLVFSVLTPFSDIHLRTHLTPPPATPG